MNFLRSVIADARPRRSTTDPADHIPAVSGEMSHRVDGEASGASEGIANRRVSTVPPDPSLPIRQVSSPSFTGDDQPHGAGHPAAPDVPTPVNTLLSMYPLRSPLDRAEPLLTKDPPVSQETDTFRASQQPSGGGEVPQPPPVRAHRSFAPIDTATEATPPDGHTQPASVAVSPDPAGPVHAAVSAAVEPVRAPDNVTARPNPLSADDHAPTRQTRTRQMASFDDGHERPAPIGRTRTERGDAAFAVPSEVHPVTDARDMDRKPLADDHEAILPTASARIESRRQDARKDDRDALAALAASDGNADKKPAGRGRPVADISRKVSSSNFSSVETEAPVQPSSGAAAALGDDAPGFPSAETEQARLSVPGAAGPAHRPGVLPTVPARPFMADLVTRDSVASPLRTASGSYARQETVPKVQIGQVDVIIDAGARSATKPVQTPPSTDLASRHYLRRL